MHELDPGHLYRPDCYPAQEGQPVRQFHNVVQFRKRIGDDYPGNTGKPCDGTSTQELLRIIVARSSYVDGQEHHQANHGVIACCRHALFELEIRAAGRRGEDYRRRWMKDFLSADMDAPIEQHPPCHTCGHIHCRKHQASEGP